MGSRRRRLLLVLATLGMLLAACSGPSPKVRSPAALPTGTAPAGPPPPTTAPGGRPEPNGGVPAFSHVFEVVMENLSYQAAMATPGFASLAHRYAWSSASCAASHPSLPNYLALTAGSTFGVTSDCLTCFVTADNLGAQLSHAGITWDAYFEGVSTPCYLGTSSGAYAAKHNPFRSFSDVRTSPELCAHLVPSAQLGPELAGPAAGVPRFVWVTPNVCDDGHSCPAAQAAAWLDRFVAEVTASQAWRQGGVLFVTWDEGSGGDTRQATPQGTIAPGGGGGHVLTLVVAPSVPPGTVVTTPLSHYALLATVERSFGLPLLGGAAARSDRTFAGFFGGGATPATSS